MWPWTSWIWNNAFFARFPPVLCLIEGSDTVYPVHYLNETSIYRHAMYRMSIPFVTSRITPCRTRGATRILPPAFFSFCFLFVLIILHWWSLLFTRISGHVTDSVADSWMRQGGRQKDLRDFIAAIEARLNRLQAHAGA